MPITSYRAGTKCLLFSSLPPGKQKPKLICNLAEKYDTNKKFQSLQRIVDVKKKRIWEILCNAKSKKQKGFGEFPQNIIIEFDKDIDEVMATADKIKY
jgi:hypothetical protein